MTTDPTPTMRKVVDLLHEAIKLAELEIAFPDGTFGPVPNNTGLTAEADYTDFFEGVREKCDHFDRGEAFEISTVEQFQGLVARMDFDKFLVIGLADEYED